MSTARTALRGGLLALLLGACSTGNESGRMVATAESCMRCHNGSLHDDYTGPGLENPHPFGSQVLQCTTCHGGNGAAETAEEAHVPPPPEIGDREFQDHNATAYFNRLTLAGMDRFEDYEVDGVTWSAMDYLQFVNPGDLRVVAQDRSCGACHEGHAECMEQGMLATAAGIFSGALYAAGVDNKVPASQGLYQDTAADMGFRAVSDEGHDPLAAELGAVAELLEFPVYSVRGSDVEGDLFDNNDLFNAAGLSDDVNPDGTVITDSPLAKLYHEQVAFTCGDCHLGSAGANNRYGDFRSSGCTACHMPYSLDGRSRSGDPNVRTDEPADPDDIDDPELPHIRRHMIVSTARTLPSGEFLHGIDDHTCAGCHQGSNRTVMQYWGIRLDQNQDVKRRRQYPADPVSFQTTQGDPRLFDPLVGNKTFNGRNANQYLLEEDYDGDGRDDTPPDIHYEAGLGCIDCHGSFDLHGGDVQDPHGSSIMSRMSQAVAIRCESCHGSVDAYAPVVSSTDSQGNPASVAVDAKGNPLHHVVREADGSYWLTSKLTGERHYVVQTRDVVVDSGKTDPRDGDPVYSVLASYAMGRDDGDPQTGLGPAQHGVGPTGFSHGDNMSCASCHASWTNNCIGCHLEGEYNGGNNFSNITGERIVFREEEAQFVYQSPVYFQLGISSKDQIEPISPNTKVFFRWKDQENQRSEVFAFSDRNAKGNNPSIADFPSLGHNVMMPHSIRGKVSASDEGPRYCVACHLTDEGLADFGTEYDELRTAMQSPVFEGLDQDLFDLLVEHIGQNPGNQLNSPLWVHMVAGLGTGLFLFDEDGGAVNPIDDNADRYGSDDVAPRDDFDLANVRYNLDRIVDEAGTATGSSSVPMADGAASTQRDGAPQPALSGPLGATLTRRLTDPATGIVLNAWIDADGQLGGQADQVIPMPE